MTRTIDGCPMLSRVLPRHRAAGYGRAWPRTVVAACSIRVYVGGRDDRPTLLYFGQTLRRSLWLEAMSFGFKESDRYASWDRECHETAQSLSALGQVRGYG